MPNTLEHKSDNLVVNNSTELEFTVKSIEQQFAISNTNTNETSRDKTIRFQKETSNNSELLVENRIRLAIKTLTENFATGNITQNEKGKVRIEAGGIMKKIGGVFSGKKDFLKESARSIQDSFKYLLRMGDNLLINPKNGERIEGVNAPVALSDFVIEAWNFKKEIESKNGSLTPKEFKNFIKKRLDQANPILRDQFIITLTQTSALNRPWADAQYQDGIVDTIAKSFEAIFVYANDTQTEFGSPQVAAKEFNDFFGSVNKVVEGSKDGRYQKTEIRTNANLIKFFVTRFPNQTVEQLVKIFPQLAGMGAQFLGAIGAALEAAAGLQMVDASTQSLSARLGKLVKDLRVSGLPAEDQLKIALIAAQKMIAAADKKSQGKYENLLKFFSFNTLNVDTKSFGSFFNNIGDGIEGTIVTASDLTNAIEIVGSLYNQAKLENSNLSSELESTVEGLQQAGLNSEDQKQQDLVINDYTQEPTPNFVDKIGNFFGKKAGVIKGYFDDRQDKSIVLKAGRKTAEVIAKTAEKGKEVVGEKLDYYNEKSELVRFTKWAGNGAAAKINQVAEMGSKALVEHLEKGKEGRAVLNYFNSDRFKHEELFVQISNSIRIVDGKNDNSYMSFKNKLLLELGLDTNSSVVDIQKTLYQKTIEAGEDKNKKSGTQILLGLAKDYLANEQITTILLDSLNKASFNNLERHKQIVISFAIMALQRASFGFAGKSLALNQDLIKMTAETAAGGGLEEGTVAASKVANYHIENDSNIFESVAKGAYAESGIRDAVEAVTSNSQGLFLNLTNGAKSIEYKTLKATPGLQLTQIKVGNNTGSVIIYGKGGKDLQASASGHTFENVKVGDRVQVQIGDKLETIRIDVIKNDTVNFSIEGAADSQLGYLAQFNGNRFIANSFEDGTKVETKLGNGKVLGSYADNNGKIESSIIRYSAVEIQQMGYQIQIKTTPEGIQYPEIRDKNGTLVMGPGVSGSDFQIKVNQNQFGAPVQAGRFIREADGSAQIDFVVGNSNVDSLKNARFKAFSSNTTSGTTAEIIPQTQATPAATTESLVPDQIVESPTQAPLPVNPQPTPAPEPTPEPINPPGPESDTVAVATPTPETKSTVDLNSGRNTPDTQGKNFIQKEIDLPEETIPVSSYQQKPTKAIDNIPNTNIAQAEPLPSGTIVTKAQIVNEKNQNSGVPPVYKPLIPDPVLVKPATPKVKIEDTRMSPLATPSSISTDPRTTLIPVSSLPKTGIFPADVNTSNIGQVGGLLQTNVAGSKTKSEITPVPSTEKIGDVKRIDGFVVKVVEAVKDGKKILAYEAINPNSKEWLDANAELQSQTPAVATTKDNNTAVPVIQPAITIDEAQQRIQKTPIGMPFILNGKIVTNQPNPDGGVIQVEVSDPKKLSYVDQTRYKNLVEQQKTNQFTSTIIPLNPEAPENRVPVSMNVASQSTALQLQLNNLIRQAETIQAEYGNNPPTQDQINRLNNVLKQAGEIKTQLVQSQANPIPTTSQVVNPDSLRTSSSNNYAKYNSEKGIVEISTTIKVKIDIGNKLVLEAKQGKPNLTIEVDQKTIENIKLGKATKAEILNSILNQVPAENRKDYEIFNTLFGKAEVAENTPKTLEEALKFNVGDITLKDLTSKAAQVSLASANTYLSDKPWAQKMELTPMTVYLLRAGYNSDNLGLSRDEILKIRGQIAYLNSSEGFKAIYDKVTQLQNDKKYGTGEYNEAMLALQTAKDLRRVSVANKTSIDPAGNISYDQIQGEQNVTLIDTQIGSIRQMKLQLAPTWLQDQAKFGLAVLDQYDFQTLSSMSPLQPKASFAERGGAIKMMENDKINRLDSEKRAILISEGLAMEAKLAKNKEGMSVILEVDPKTGLNVGIKEVITADGKRIDPGVMRQENSFSVGVDGGQLALSTVMGLLTGTFTIPFGFDSKVENTAIAPGTQALYNEIATNPNLVKQATSTLNHDANKIFSAILTIAGVPHIFSQSETTNVREGSTGFQRIDNSGAVNNNPIDGNTAGSLQMVKYISENPEKLNNALAIMQDPTIADAVVKLYQQREGLNTSFSIYSESLKRNVTGEEIKQAATFTAALSANFEAKEQSRSTWTSIIQDPKFKLLEVNTNRVLGLGFQINQDKVPELIQHKIDQAGLGKEFAAKYNNERENLRNLIQQAVSDTANQVDAGQRFLELKGLNKSDATQVVNQVQQHISTGFKGEKQLTLNGKTYTLVSNSVKNLGLENVIIEQDVQRNNLGKQRNVGTTPLFSEQNIDVLKDSNGKIVAVFNHLCIGNPGGIAETELELQETLNLKLNSPHKNEFPTHIATPEIIAANAVGGFEALKDMGVEMEILNSSSITNQLNFLRQALNTNTTLTETQFINNLQTQIPALPLDQAKIWYNGYIGAKADPIAARLVQETSAESNFVAIEYTKTKKGDATLGIGIGIALLSGSEKESKTILVIGSELTRLRNGNDLEKYRRVNWRGHDVNKSTVGGAKIQIDLNQPQPTPETKKPAPKTSPDAKSPTPPASTTPPAPQTIPQAPGAPNNTGIIQSPTPVPATTPAAPFTPAPAANISNTAPSVLGNGTPPSNPASIINNGTPARTIFTAPPAAPNPNSITLPGARPLPVTGRGG